MSDKREVLQTYLAGHNIPKEISEKISYTSISTPNFSYYAFRVGNSIGDVLELAMDFILAKTICEKNDLILYTVEHCEFHSKDITEGDLDRLVKAAEMFEKHKKGEKFSQLKEEINQIAYKKFSEYLNS
ncbi:MAG: hypothetical protein H7A24_04535 [Leptospiraceae bacterium]|nr:hypothetical protein [Leptospiraceae bacterium]MCP5511123.1 hypothetical protein [Leptospiraceae bacterium]